MLIKMLRTVGGDRHIDVLASTHNPALLNRLGPEMVPFVVVAHRSPHFGLSELTLLEDVANLPKLMAVGPLGQVTASGALERSLASQYRFERATALSELMSKAADEASPWAAFSDQQTLWAAEGLKKLAAEWPKLAAQKLSIGDATITQVADHYAQMGFQVEIYTGDQGLKAHQLAVPPPQPRRRK